MPLDAWAESVEGLQAQADEIKQASNTTLVLATRKNVPPLVLEAIGQNHFLRTLHLEMTEFGDGGCEALCRSGAPSEQLQTLKLGRNQITSHGLPALSTFLKRSRLTSLDLCCNPLGGALDVLGHAVAQSDTMTSLNLDETQARGEGVAALVHALTENRRERVNQLRVLSLQGNHIDDQTAAQVAKPLIAECRSLEQVLLSRNAIGDLGGTAIGDAIEQHCEASSGGGGPSHGPRLALRKLSTPQRFLNPGLSLLSL